MVGAMQISGDITYNGEPFANFYPQRTAAYVDQVKPWLLTQLTSHSCVNRVLQIAARYSW